MVKYRINVTLECKGCGAKSTYVYNTNTKLSVGDKRGISCGKCGRSSTYISDITDAQ